MGGSIEFSAQSAIRKADPLNISFEVLQYSTNFIHKFKELNPKYFLNESYALRATQK